MENLKLRAWDHFNQMMIYSSEDDSVFILHENKWKIKYTREKTIQRGDVEIDAPVWEESDDVEVMRFTGLHDKNEKDIYEGDIVISNASVKREIVWSDSNFTWYANNGNEYQLQFSISHYAMHDFAIIEVIGNAHQHPNLLK